MKKEKKGFTLIELLVAITIVGIISIISIVFSINIIADAKRDVEISNTKILSKLTSEKMSINEMQNNNELNKEQFFVIENNSEYLVNKDGTKTPTNYFNYNGKYCNFCVIKIKSQEEISILLEGETQDVRKNYDSSNTYTTPLIISREVTSLYNELELFKEIYLLNNKITETKRFVFENGVIYELQNDGPKLQVFRINNKTLKGKITIDESLKSEYMVEKDDNIITINSTGKFEKKENVNSEYSTQILDLYEEIKYSAQKYIKNNTISSDVYFEFNNGKISLIDLYGNQISSNITMNSTVMGSGELKINTSKQYEITIYDNDDNIKNNYGSDELHREKLKFSRDVSILFKNLSRLELLAEKYLNGATSTDFKPSKSDWLVFYYIRQLKYTGSNWNTVSSSDTAFVTYVNNNASYLKNYFKNKNNFTVNDDVIDLKHMAAVLATCMYQTASGAYSVLSQTTVNSVASWAGDLQTFMVDNLLPSVTDKTVTGYKKATMEMLGKSNTSFNMDDIYADTDGWIIYYNLSNNTSLSISKAFEEFYLGKGARSYKNRFTSFKNTVLNSTNGSKSAFSNLVYKFTKQNYEYDLILFTYTEKWPLFGSHTISSTMSQGVRDGFTEWIYSQIEKE